MKKRVVIFTLTLLVMLTCLNVCAVTGNSTVMEVLRLTSLQGMYIPYDPDPWISGSSVVSLDFPSLANETLSFDLTVWNLSPNITAYDIKLIVSFTSAVLDPAQVRNMTIEGGIAGKQLCDFENRKLDIPRLHAFQYWIEDVYDDEICAGYTDNYLVGRLTPGSSVSLRVTIQFGVSPQNSIRVHFDVYGFTLSPHDEIIFPDVRNSKWDDVTLMFFSTMPFIPESPFGTIVPMSMTLLAAGIYLLLKRQRASME